MSERESRLARRLGVGDAVVVGLGAMVGAGVFSAVGPAARAAGPGLLVGLVLAAFVAWCNATSSAQLAALYPESGGTYVYGRRRLGPLWGWLAGWGFVVGKLASCSAMALTFGYYAAPGLARPLAAGAVAVLTAVNWFGVKKTVALTRVLLGVVLCSLGLVVTGVLAGGELQVGRLWPLVGPGGVYGILQSAGLLFFAFAGYARIATLGEEVLEPERTIPRAIPRALGVTLGVYTVVMVAALLAVPAEELARAEAPLARAVAAGSWAWVAPGVRLGATVACLGVLLSLIVGVSRTMFAMAAAGELPRWLAAVHPVHRVPHHAELVVGATVAGVVLLVDVREAIGFSSFAVLTYYAIANASALTLAAHERRWPRWLAWAGVVGCAALALSVPVASVVAGAGVLLSGVGGWAVRRRLLTSP